MCPEVVQAQSFQVYFIGANDPAGETCNDV